MAQLHSRAHRHLSRGQFDLVERIASLLRGNRGWALVLQAAVIARRQARLVRAYHRARADGVSPADIARFIHGPTTRTSSTAQSSGGQARVAADNIHVAGVASMEEADINAIIEADQSRYMQWLDDERAGVPTSQYPENENIPF